MKHKHTLRDLYSSVNLYEEERDNMRMHVMTHVREQGSCKPSPYFPFLVLPSSQKTIAGLFLSLTVLVGTGGVSYASSEALPGDRLYAFKKIGESIESMAAFSSESVVRTAGKHALRRIKETTSLKAKGPISPEIELDIAQSLQKNLNTISTIVQTQGPDTATAQESAVALGKIVGYTNVLSYVDAQGHFTTEVENFSRSALVTEVAASEAGAVALSPVITVAEAFVAEHEDVIAEAVTNDAEIVAEQFVTTISDAVLSETTDPLTKATIQAIVASETIGMFVAEQKGARVLHALADMAEGEASHSLLSQE
ncbi:MAG: hypothetical protein RI911_251 [Candidatus Parcubacteria bacterium]|jgi:hypothetical protein